MIFRLETKPLYQVLRSILKLLCLGLLSVSLVHGQTGPAELKVAAVQFRSSYDVSDNLKRMVEVLDRLAAQQVQVAVFPECALTGYYVGLNEPTAATAIVAAEETLRQTCRDKKIAAVFGSVYKVNGHAYDSAVVYNSRGELVERYGKIYLAGEKWATRGNHISLFDLEGVSSTVLICHDERYPEVVRLPAMEGARIVYYISAESPLKEESKLAPYRAQMMARAVENCVYVVAANAPANNDLTGSHGQSRIIDTDGNILQEASMFGEDTLILTLKLPPGKLKWPENIINGPMGDWWRSGLDWLMQNRQKQLR